MTKTPGELIDRYLFTVEEYHQLGEAGIIPADSRVELINGEIIHMSPIKSHHAGTVKLLNRLIASQSLLEIIVGVQDPIHLSTYSEPEPDLSILKFRADHYTQSHPKPEDVLIVIEVADTSLEKDRTVKLPLYAAAGIPEAWIINLVEQQIEVSTEPSAKGYANLHIYRQGDTIEHPVGGTIAVDSIFIIPAK